MPVGTRNTPPQHTPDRRETPKLSPRGELRLERNAAKTPHSNPPMPTQRRAQSWFPVLWSLVFLALIAAAIEPQVRGGRKQRQQQARFYQQLLELKIERYRGDHGVAPQQLSDLTRTNDPNLEGGRPYLQDIPVEPVSRSNQVSSADNPDKAGWIYDANLGRVRPAWSVPHRSTAEARHER